MSTKKPISKLTIQGFKSIRNLESLRLSNLNVLIGANGAGKSNFVSFFRMLSELIEQRFQVWIKNQGGIDRILSNGIKNTHSLSFFVQFGKNGYNVVLKPMDVSGVLFHKEEIFFKGPYYGDEWRTLGNGHLESNLKNNYEKSESQSIEDYCYSSITSWRVYHFHDTSDTAAVKRVGSLHDNEYLRSDAGNLAAYLFYLRENHKDCYEEIRNVVKLAIPFFDDFVLRPRKLPTGEEQVNLLWRQADSDYPFWPSQLSDGSLRFVCLATALLQPDPPSTIIIDEPELGLHPYAITLLGALLRSNSQRMQTIVSTQSVPLLNEFSLDNLIVVEREDGNSVFKRLTEQDFTHWLEEYTVGELWEKNILGGRPGR